MNRKFLLCFHDFSVWNYNDLTPILHELRDLVGRPFSILVIPGTEGASSEALNGFRLTLEQLKREGFELALHGYKHKAGFSQGRNYGGLVAMSLTHGEAEFAGLSEYESSRMLQQSISAWDELFSSADKDIDLSPAAFVPPTWYSNKFLPRQVKAAKMLYEDRFTLNTAAGRRIISPVASFAGIPRQTEAIALAFARAFLRFPAGIPRIALHPVDFPHMRSQIRNLLRTALQSKRRIVHYSEL